MSQLDHVLNSYIKNINESLSSECLKLEKENYTLKLNKLKESNAALKKESNKYKLELEKTKDQNTKLIEDEIFLYETYKKMKSMYVGELKDNLLNIDKIKSIDEIKTELNIN